MAKRYWYRWAEGIHFLESAPIEVFDKWAESALLREGLVPSSEQFGDPEQRPKPQPVVRFDKSCGNVVTDWLKLLNEHQSVKRHQVHANFAIPAHYPLSAIIMTRYGSVWDAIPTLVLRWQHLIKPAVVIFDGLNVPHNQVYHQSQMTHTMLSRLVGGTKNTACYGPVATARLE